MQKRRKATLKFYETCKKSKLSISCLFREKTEVFVNIWSVFDIFWSSKRRVKVLDFGIELLYFKNCDIIREKVHKCKDYGRRPPTHLSLPICKTIDLIAKSKNSIIQYSNHFDNFKEASG